MILFKNLSFGYRGQENQLLRGINLRIPERQMVLVCGPTGSGKSTLLKLVNGLAPHFTGGELSGEILVNDFSVVQSKPNELASLIGYVNQQPEGAFVSDTVASEILFGMEQLGFDPEVMRERLLEIAKQTGLEKLLEANLEELSGGQQQTVAIAAALAAGQKLLLLDEPTSALDQAAAETVIALLRRLIDETGITVILAEHRIERVLEMVDSVLLVDLDGSVQLGAPEEVFRDYRLVPPVVQLGQKLGWNPLILSLKLARNRLVESQANFRTVSRLPNQKIGQVLLSASNILVKYRAKVAVNVSQLEVHSGEVVALMGPNGAGKSSLLFRLWQDNQELVTLVPQRAADLLFLPSVHLEFEESDRLSGKAPGSTAALFTKLSQRVDPAAHPRDLSTGQQLALVLATQLVKDSDAVLLDEPTGGLDYQAKSELANWILELRSQGKAVLVASHDTEFIAACADRVIELSEGQIHNIDSVENLLDHRGDHRTQLAEVFEKDGLISLRQIEVNSA
ncbi:MAG: ATP-binding cassette domain-containing protein [Actinomycetes bacterium]